MPMGLSSYLALAIAVIAAALVRRMLDNGWQRRVRRKQNAALPEGGAETRAAAEPERDC
jgi:hypothetical protein